MSDADVDAELEQADAAFARADWASARELYQQAVDRGAGARALDRLGEAVWWLGDEDRAVELRSRAFPELRREGALESAAYVAMWLAAEYRLAGNASVSNGWLGRAKRLLEEVDECPARVWHDVELSKRASDPEDEERHAREAVATARRLGDAGLEALTLSHVGHALVRQGDIEAGFALCDEAIAIATGSEPADPLTIGDACCTTLVACDLLADPLRVRDLGRAIADFVRRRGFLPLSSWCRGVYAGFLIASGDWEEAERELQGALADAEGVENANRSTALINFAALRLRQGRPEEAERLLAGLEDRPAALETAVELDLARGEVELAAEKVARRLEALGDDDPALRAPLLAVRARVELASAEPEAAAETALAARAAAEGAGREDLLARAEVLVARAARLGGGAADPSALEGAIDTLAATGMPLEEGEARLELALALAPDHGRLAVEHARAALGVFERLGAARHADEAAAVLRELGAPGRPAPRSGAVLTRREREVLELLGEGLGNAEIAERLVISPRTAEHHVAKILGKLELRNRAEAAAYAVREGADGGMF